MSKTQHLNPLADRVVIRHWLQDARAHLGNLATWMAAVDANGQLVMADPVD